MRNAEIAAALEELAVLYELDGAVRYRFLAYKEAARVIRQSPVSVSELAREGREQLQHWAEAERDLWKGWFDVAREINFRPEPGTGAQAGKDLLQLWQESTHKMIDTQAALIRRWTGGTTKTREQE